MCIANESQFHCRSDHGDMVVGYVGMSGGTRLMLLMSYLARTLAPMETIALNGRHEAVVCITFLFFDHIFTQMSLLLDALP